MNDLCARCLFVSGLQTNLLNCELLCYDLSVTTKSINCTGACLVIQAGCRCFFEERTCIAEVATIFEKSKRRNLLFSHSRKIVLQHRLEQHLTGAVKY